MQNYLRLIRLPNLLMIGLTQALVRYCLILPAFKAEFFITGFFPPHLSEVNFYLLVFSTLLIASGGYIINDYFDIQTDAVNKPGKNSVGVHISKANAKRLYLGLSLAGITIGFYLAFSIAKPMLGFLHVFTSVSLWMYASYYKKRFLSGNILVSFLCALSIFIVGLFEPEFYRNIVYLSWYAFLAFMVNLIREIIKDMEDMEGDSLAECRTLPVVWGISKTKILIQLFVLLTLLFIFFVLYDNFFTNSVISFWYLVGIAVIPFAALSWLVYSASEKKDFYYASLYTKLLMAAGILSLIPFWYYFIR